MENDPLPFRRLLLGAVSLFLVACLVPAMASAAPVESSPTSLDFGQQTVGKVSTAKTVEIANPGPGAVQVLGAMVTGLDTGDFAVAGESCGGGTLQPSESCQVEVAFEPQAGGARSATLEIAIEGQSAIDVPLSGTGQTMRLTVPVSAAFPTTTVGGASTEKVLLKNGSEAWVNVGEVKIEGTAASDFAIEGSGCNVFIGPGMSCELSVRFTPAASGTRAAMLRVISTGTPAEYVTELTGEGAPAEVAFEPGEYDFGLIETHSGGPRTNFTLRNTGAASVQLSNLEISGPDAGEFWIPSSNCWGSMLSPGSTCAVEVQFNANNVGSYSAAVAIQAGGVGFLAPLTARAENPKVTASPSPLVFGPTPVGSRQVEEVTLSNTGHLPVAFFIALVSGGDIGSFHLLEENCTSDVFAGRPRIFEPGESCSAKIAFEPTVVGTKAATVSFFGGGEGALQVPVQGEAVAPQLQVSPTSRDVGGVAPAATGATSASAKGLRGHVTLSLTPRPHLKAGKVIVGRARCDSPEACVVQISGLASARIPTRAGSRPEVRGVPAVQLKLAPGATESISATLPRAFRDSPTGATVRIAIRWRTGPERGSTFRAYRVT